MKTKKINQHKKFAFSMPKTLSSQVKVVGIGGCGSNAVNHLQSFRLEDTDLVVCNTDSQALEHSPVANKFQLGEKLTYGTGAGGDPEMGKKAAQESLKELEQIAESRTKVVILTAGMGGGTGTGALPVVAKMLKEKNILTIAMVTFPFDFEGPKRLELAKKGIEELSNSIDSLLILRNNVLRKRYGDMGVEDAFKKSDEVLVKSTSCILKVLTQHFTINIDLQDLQSVLNRKGQSVFGYSTAGGPDRAKKVISKVLDSPLLAESCVTDVDKALLLILSKNKDVRIKEVEEITQYFNQAAQKEVNFILGFGTDDTLGNEIGVILIASGIEKAPIKQDVNYILGEEVDTKLIFKCPYHELGLLADKNNQANQDLSEESFPLDEKDQYIDRDESPQDEILDTSQFNEPEDSPQPAKNQIESESLGDLSEVLDLQKPEDNEISFREYTEQNSTEFESAEKNQIEELKFVESDSDQGNSLTSSEESQQEFEENGDLQELNINQVDVLENEELLDSEADRVESQPVEIDSEFDNFMKLSKGFDSLNEVEFISKSIYDKEVKSTSRPPKELNEYYFENKSNLRDQKKRK